MDDDDEDESPPFSSIFSFAFGQPMTEEQMQQHRDRMTMMLEAQEREFLQFLQSLKQDQFDVLHKTLYGVYHNPELMPFVLGKLSVVQMLQFKNVETLLEETGSDDQD